MKIGVTGASGNLGRASARLLLEQVDPRQLVLISRKPDDLGDLAERGADIRLGDFERPETLKSAFAGVERLLMISTDQIGSRLPGHRSAIEVAAEAGVKHVAYTSVANPTDDNPAIVSWEHRATEELLRASGMAWTFLRNGVYADLQLEAAAAVVRSGALLTNAGSGRNGYVTRADCAAAAVAVLTGDGHERKTYDITGPEALDPAEVVSIYAEVGEAAVTVSQLGDEAWIAAMVENAGLATPVAIGYASFGIAQRSGYLGLVTGTVERLTGRPPESLREFLARNRDSWAT